MHTLAGVDNPCVECSGNTTTECSPSCEEGYDCILLPRTCQSCPQPVCRPSGSGTISNH